MVFETCIICQCDLLSQGSSASNSEGPEVSALACGHVYHRRCIDQWLLRSDACPNCKRKVEHKVDKLFFNEDEFASELEEPEKEKAWYEQYDKELLFGAGAVAGAVVVGLVSSIFGGGKKKNNRD